MVTDTASVHAAAWKRMFDDFLSRYAARQGVPFEPFEIDIDYLAYVDEKPRLDGIRSFYDFNPQMIPKNIAYYLERSSHGSTLSNIVHSWVLARSDLPRSWELFHEALESDISDVQGGTTHEGIHLGAMAGTVDILQRGYTGLEFHDDILFLNPKVPQGLSKLSVRIKFRGNWFDICAKPESMTIASDKCELRATKVGIQGKVYDLSPGETMAIDIGQK